MIYLMVILGNSPADLQQRLDLLSEYCSKWGLQVNMCLREIEDDFHFVIKCPAYSAITSKYISHYFYRRPSVFKYVSLLQSSHFGTVINLGKYIYFAFALRKQLTNDN